MNHLERWIFEFNDFIAELLGPTDVQRPRRICFVHSPYGYNFSLWQHAIKLLDTSCITEIPIYLLPKPTIGQPVVCASCLHKCTVVSGDRKYMVISKKYLYQSTDH